MTQWNDMRVSIAINESELPDRIREVFNVGRMARLEGQTGGYSHNAGTVSGVLVQIEGGNEAAAKRFRDRVESAEALAAADGKDWTTLALDEQYAYYDRAKELA